MLPERGYKRLFDEINLDLIELVATLVPKHFGDFGLVDGENIEVVAERSDFFNDTRLGFGAGESVDEIRVGDLDGLAGSVIFS